LLKNHPRITHLRTYQEPTCLASTILSSPGMPLLVLM
jgi:hypothetical protein